MLVDEPGEAAGGLRSYHAASARASATLGPQIPSGSPGRAGDPPATRSVVSTLTWAGSWRCSALELVSGLPKTSPAPASWGKPAAFWALLSPIALPRARLKDAAGWQRGSVRAELPRPLVLPGMGRGRARRPAPAFVRRLEGAEFPLSGMRALNVPYLISNFPCTCPSAAPLPATPRTICRLGARGRTCRGALGQHVGAKRLRSPLGRDRAPIPGHPKATEPRCDPPSPRPLHPQPFHPLTSSTSAPIPGLGVAMAEGGGA